MRYCRYHDILLCDEHAGDCLGGDRCDPQQRGPGTLLFKITGECSVCAGVILSKAKREAALKTTPVKGTLTFKPFERGEVTEQEREELRGQLDELGRTLQAKGLIDFIPEDMEPAKFYALTEEQRQALAGATVSRFADRIDEPNEIGIPVVGTITFTNPPATGVITEHRCDGNCRECREDDAAYNRHLGVGGVHPGPREGCAVCGA